jgi:aryl-alcohol dehydrogenase-like predicted oxidoreductase
MVTRREWFKLSATAGAALALNPEVLSAIQRNELITRPIPSTGERLPIVGLGSSATFGQAASGDDLSAIREVFRTLVENGGSVFDTAPSYSSGASEEAAGTIVSELGIEDRVFWATKVNVADRETGLADPARARAQIEDSFRRLRAEQVDCIQVHNLGDVPTQLGILKELKEEGRIRYIGVTTTPRDDDYTELEAVMRDEPIDFIGIDYAVDNRGVETRVLPLAQDQGIGVMVYLPFGRTRLWDRVRGHEVPPEWAQEFGAESWGQFFIKFVAAHPAVTVVTPATSQARHMLDNLGAATGRVPDESERQRMIEFVDALPQA